MITSRTLALLAGVLCLQLAAKAKGQNYDTLPAPQTSLTIEVLDHMTRLPGGLTALPKPLFPRANPQSRAKIDLGRMLFFDQRLSLDGSISCASCHDPGKGYSDGRSRAVGISHTVLRRRSPSLLNAAYNSVQFWDGRVKSLENQALAPMLARHEMGMPGPKALLTRLRTVPDYRRKFRQTFGRDVNLEDVRRAIASFERTLITPNSAFDSYVGGDSEPSRNNRSGA
jgi:cytochrome c peroxidase